MARYAPIYAGDRMIGGVFGGVLMGAGLAIIFLRGSTTGGTDIISFLVKKWYPHVPIGRMIMVVDCIIIGVSVLVFGNLESALYGLISLYCCSMVIDSIIYGLDKGSMVMVVSEKNDEIAAQIMDELERGVTLLKRTGSLYRYGQGCADVCSTQAAVCQSPGDHLRKRPKCFCDCQ